jgi:chemosensory pili system protein ChpA (sensor histidine kinase/response regulator)
MSQTILVVEDEAANLRLLCLFLEKQGYRVLQARDGLEAMDLVGECRVDVVLSDIRMPRMDGVALTRHILSKVPNTPVLVMTAYAAQDVKGLSELRVPVLNKPVMLDQLNEQIQIMLSSRRITN